MGAGADGAVVGAVCSRIERASFRCAAKMTRRMLVAKKTAARIAVVRVRRFAVDLPVMNPDIPPPPPIPSAPPSLFCRSTEPTSATAIIRWMTRMMVCMGSEARNQKAEAGKQAGGLVCLLMLVIWLLLF